MRRGFAIALLLVSARARADAPTIDPCGSSMTKPNVQRPASLTGDWGGARDTLDDHGVDISGNYAPEIFASPETDPHDVIAGLAVLSIDLSLDKLITRGLGSVHIVGLGIHGKGLSEQIQDIYGVSNNVAQPDVRLFEAWVEQPITDRAAVRVGLLSADQEYVIARHSTVLMNSTFGVIGQVSANEMGQPVYPIARPGVSGHVDVVEPVTVRAAAYEGEPTDEHGLPTRFVKQGLFVGEIELWKRLKLGGWHHTALADGAYAVFDRGFKSLGRRVGMFARVGYSPHGIVQLYADAGVRGLPGDWRHDDFAGLGVAYSRTEIMGVRHDQAVIEATYQAAATGWWTVQPDLQLVFAPDRTALVGAIRMTIVF